MIFVVGGSSNSNVYAFLIVSYPAGSTCTATNGTKTLRAKNTSGSWVFNIPTPKNLPETWTVTSKNNGNTKTSSKSVVINTEGQWEEITLAYRYDIIINGDTPSGVTLNTNLTSAGMTFAKYGDGQDSFLLASCSTTHSAGFTAPLLDISSYQELKIEIAKKTGQSAKEICLGIFKQQTHNTYDYSTIIKDTYAKLQMSPTAEFTIQSCSLSNLTTGYPGLLINTGGASNIGMSIKNMWLE